jgi:hypothetical protein
VRALFLFLACAGIAHADLSGQPPGTGNGTYCEFQVVHAESKKPFGGMRYTMTLPSGKKVRGRVPKSGLVHVDVPHSGNCTIEFDMPGFTIADGK